MTPEERAARAARLREFLDHPDVKDAVSSVEADLIDAWKRAFDPAERENLWRCQHVLGLLIGRLGSWSSADIQALRRAK